MYIIVIGCGKVGAKLALSLAEEGHDIVIVDKDSNAFKNLGGNFSGVTITGVPIDQDVLKQAGIENADALAAVTPDDNVNVMVSQVAQEIFKVPKVITRIYNPTREHVFHEFGLETICPTDLTAQVIHSKIMGNGGVTKHAIGNQDFLFLHERVTKSQEGKKLDAIRVENGSMIFGIIRNGRFEFAGNAITLTRDDILVIAQKG